MKTKSLLLAAPLVLALAACGSSDTTTAFTLASGSYNPSAGTATSAYATDDCNMVGTFGLGAFALLGGGRVRRAVRQLQLLGRRRRRPPRADGHRRERHLAKSTTPAAFETVFTNTCLANTIVRVVSGELTANDQLHLVVQYDISNAASSLLHHHRPRRHQVLPCTSQVDFIASKASGTMVVR